jgi:hypothetical protein
MNSIVLEAAARSVQARRRIRQHIFETPLLPSRQIGRETGASVSFKAENFQLTGSFARARPRRHHGIVRQPWHRIGAGCGVNRSGFDGRVA